MHNRIAFKKNLIEVIPDIISLSYTKFDNTFPSYMHSHTATEIIFVTNGEGCLNTLDKPIPMVRGNILLINGNILHTETQTADKNPLEYYVLALDNIRFSEKQILNDDIGENTEVFCITALKERFTEIQDLFYKMFSEMQTTAAYGANLTIGYLMIFLSMLVRQANMSVCSTKKEPHPYSSVVGYAKNFIDCYYNINFKIHDIADQISVSYSQLYHKFVQEIGISPVEYKMYKQIDEAKSMLKNSDFSISQISVQAGFNDLAYFIKIFHKKTGFTPKDFRKNSKKSADTAPSSL